MNPSSDIFIICVILALLAIAGFITIILKLYLKAPHDEHQPDPGSAPEKGKRMKCKRCGKEVDEIWRFGMCLDCTVEADHLNPPPH